MKVYHITSLENISNISKNGLLLQPTTELRWIFFDPGFITCKFLFDGIRPLYFLTTNDFSKISNHLIQCFKSDIINPYIITCEIDEKDIYPDVDFLILEDSLKGKLDKENGEIVLQDNVINLKELKNNRMLQLDLINTYKVCCCIKNIPLENIISMIQVIF